ncbi:MAG: DUF6273 domain-containing protein [Defluviitaleaceae bacterium]|nr:DUF6273 domain-containing protein [Defluviitaleaceae bacterium]
MQRIEAYKIWILACALLMLFIIVVIRHEQVFLATGLRQPTTIADIAYDVRNGRADYRIFLKENGNFTPYLVLTANYNGSGNVLLLREHLLDQTVAFNYSPYGRNLWSGLDFGSYYPNSNIDTFLNTEFVSTLCEAVIAAMAPSDIEVTDKGSIGVTGRTSNIITRYVFLLSLRELDGPRLNVSVPEGRALRFFRNDFTRRTASFSNGMSSPYWTRTPETWNTSVVFTMGVQGIGAGVADLYTGVRPAFAMCRSTTITTSTDIINGENVFVLDISG